jgi:prepilin-type N-terminal cleavage/methylation domain-containing protein
MKKSSRGFTLIELLVVIAIIGILSSVVLASLTTARTRGTAAAIQSELANMRAQGELYYSTNSNQYATTDGITATATASSLLNAGATNGIGNLITDVLAKGATSPTFAASTTGWAMQVLYNGTYYCVDSVGNSKSGTATFAPITDGNGCN